MDNLFTMDHDKEPKQAFLLFQNLFGGCSPDTSFELVAQGLSASRGNAERLLSDARLLVDAGRLSSARFLLTTALEELAKSYILVDTCRLDLERHHSVLRRLCQAFYNHISKHAYLELLEFPNIKSMSDAKVMWETEVKRWWPASREDGEPDMPHDTYFDRELPLYIDYGDYDGRWLVPTDSDQTAHFMEMFGKTPVSKMEKLIEPWRKADSIGISSAKVLSILNAIFKKHYIQEGAVWEQLVRLYEKTADRIKVEIGISPELFMASPFVKWPLYHFVCENK
jgi:AbiV family abortive infection protein